MSPILYVCVYVFVYVCIWQTSISLYKMTVYQSREQIFCHLSAVSRKPGIIQYPYWYYLSIFILKKKVKSPNSITSAYQIILALLRYTFWCAQGQKDSASHLGLPSRGACPAFFHVGAEKTRIHLPWICTADEPSPKSPKLLQLPQSLAASSFDDFV